MVTKMKKILRHKINNFLAYFSEKRGTSDSVMKFLISFLPLNFDLKYSIACRASQTEILSLQYKCKNLFLTHPSNTIVWQCAKGRVGLDSNYFNRLRDALRTRSTLPSHSGLLYFYSLFYGLR